MWWCLRLVNGSKLLAWLRCVVWHATWLSPPPPIGSWPDLDLTSSLNWPMKVIMYMFRIVAIQEKHNGANPMSASFLVQKLYRLQFPRHLFLWPLVTSILTWPPPQKKCKSCTSLTELFNAVCRLSLWCLVFEIWPGGRKGPPPRSEPFRARPE